MTRFTLDSFVTRSLLVACTVLGLAAPALADSPAAIRGPGQERAQTAFEQFAVTWMDKVRNLEEEQKKNPTVRPGAASPIVTYRGYGDEVSTELRPTGHPSAPYVGILRYSEHLYSCASVEATKCTIASTVPVTEIFRYENGRWVY